MKCTGVAAVGEALHLDVGKRLAPGSGARDRSPGGGLDQRPALHSGAVLGAARDRGANVSPPASARLPLADSSPPFHRATASAPHPAPGAPGLDRPRPAEGGDDAEPDEPRRDRPRCRPARQDEGRRRQRDRAPAEDRAAIAAHENHAAAQTSHSQGSTMNSTSPYDQRPSNGISQRSAVVVEPV